MAKKELIIIGNKSFEDLKKANEFGAEYWSARELQPLLGYTQWRRFEDAVKRAATSCKQSGNESLHHFAGVGKMIELGRVKSAAPKLELEEKDAKGLIGKKGEE